MRIASIVGLLVMAGTARAQVPQLTPLTRFGCESCEGPALFTRINSLAIAPDQRILVADQSAPRVRIFDVSGRVQAAFGRTGQGPAELGHPAALSVAPNGTVEVIDMTRRRLMRFGPAGEDRGSVALGGFADGAFAPQGGHAVAIISAPMAPVLKLFRVTGDQATPLLRIKNSDFPMRLPGSIENLSVAVAPDGSFAVGDGMGAYLIRRFKSDGTPTGETGRTIARVRRTAEEIRLAREARSRMIDAMLARAGRGATAPPLSDIPAERDYFEAGGLRFDEKGRLWVRVERNTSGRTVFDVFDAAGRYIGEVSVPVEFRTYAVGAGLLAAVVADDAGVPQVHVWTINGPKAGEAR